MGLLPWSTGRAGSEHPNEEWGCEDFCLGCLAFKMSVSLETCWRFRTGFQKSSWAVDPRMGINPTEASADSLELTEGETGGGRGHLWSWEIGSSISLITIKTLNFSGFLFPFPHPNSKCYEFG